MQDPIYIFGHKNPDADAICSAIAYSAYKKAIGQSGYLPARCGNSNVRIDTIMERFNVQLPEFIGDVYPRVEDIMVTEVFKVDINATCAEALDVMDKCDVQAVPVIDSDNTLKGILSISQLGELFVPHLNDPHSMRLVRTHISAIMRSLNAKPLHVVDTDSIAQFYVRVGAMSLDSFGCFRTSKKVKPEESIVIVGDRDDIQQKAIGMGVRLLIIAGGFSINDNLIEEAKKQNVSIISSPFDSATTAWLVRAANLIEPLVEKAEMCFGVDQRLSQVKHKVADSKGIPLFPVICEHNKLLGVFNKTDLLKPVRANIVLVDHNELSQAVDGAGEVNITEIVDHHRLGNIHTPQPILFYNEPVGSTCTIVAGLFNQQGLKPTPEIAGVLMAGVISDTLNLQGPTTTEKDKEILAWLEGIAGMSSDDLADLIFSSGSVILGQKPDSVILSDCKTYNEGSISFSISQVEELGFDNFWDHADELQEALDKYCKHNGLYMSGLLVTDINKQDSLFVVAGDANFIHQISYAESRKKRIFEMPNIVSRKKQLIPYITQLLSKAGAPAEV